MIIDHNYDEDVADDQLSVLVIFDMLQESDRASLSSDLDNWQQHGEVHQVGKIDSHDGESQ